MERARAWRRGRSLDAERRSARSHRARRRGQLRAALVDDGKATGLVDPSLDTASIVHFAHAVGLGFLLFQAVGADNPDVDAWDAVVRRMVDAVVPPTEPKE